jgi:hypothetical protein
MHQMLAAELAEFFDFELTAVVLFVPFGCIIPVFASGTAQKDDLSHVTIPFFRVSVGSRQRTPPRSGPIVKHITYTPTLLCAYLPAPPG